MEMSWACSFVFFRPTYGDGFNRGPLAYKGADALQQARANRPGNALGRNWNVVLQQQCRVSYFAAPHLSPPPPLSSHSHPQRPAISTGRTTVNLLASQSQDRDFSTMANHFLTLPDIIPTTAIAAAEAANSGRPPVTGPSDVPYTCNNNTYTDDDGFHFSHRSYFTNQGNSEGGATPARACLNAANRDSFLGHIERFIHLIDRPNVATNQTIHDYLLAQQDLNIRLEGRLVKLEWRTRFQQDSSVSAIQGGVPQVDHEWSNRYTLDLTRLMAGTGGLQGTCPDAATAAGRPADPQHSHSKSRRSRHRHHNHQKSRHSAASAADESGSNESDDSNSPYSDSNSADASDSSDEDEVELEAERSRLRSKYEALGQRLKQAKKTKDKRDSRRKDKDKERERNTRNRDKDSRRSSRVDKRSGSGRKHGSGRHSG